MVLRPLQQDGARHSCQRFTIVRIKSNGLSEKVLLLLQALQGLRLIVGDNASDDQGVRILIDLPRLSLARRGNENLSPERVYDPSCNLILEREQVGAVAVEAVGPNLDRASPIDELCAYAHVLATSLHAAFEGKLHSEVA